MRNTQAFSINISFRAILAGAFCAIAINHVLMLGLRGLSLVNENLVAYNSSFVFLFFRTLIMALSFFLAGFLASLISRAKTNFNGVLNAAVAMSLFHITTNIIWPNILFQEVLQINIATTSSLFFLRNFLVVSVGWISGFYGGVLAVKLDLNKFQVESKEQRPISV